VVYVALALMSLGVADLVRAPIGNESTPRAVFGSVVGASTVIAESLLIGFGIGELLLVGLAALGILLAWTVMSQVAFGSRFRRAALWVPALALAIAFAAGGSTNTEPGGALGEWYEGLSWPFVGSVPLIQFLMAISGTLFLLATSNRVVRLVLELADAPAEDNEGRLKGGRIIGQMERLMIAALVLVGQFAGAALVITAKGLIRLPEITGDSGGDDAAEYLIIGTFASLMLGASVAVLTLAAG
jgi:hypothetical protein